MRVPAPLLAGLLLLSATPEAFADGRNPGSVLVYPMHRSGFATKMQPGTGDSYSSFFFTILSVSNTNLLPATPNNALGGTTGIHWEYVNITPDPNSNVVPQLPLFCNVANVRETLTPADTRAVLTSCHNGAFFQEGYVVLSATNPDTFDDPWKFDYLIGSELVVNSVGGMYSLNAVPFNAGAALNDKAPTDIDQDDRLDFDGIEYERMPDELYIDSFLAIANSSLILMNFTGGTGSAATVRIDIWNDFEQALSAVFSFKCWFEERLVTISPFFSEPFLRGNTPNDPIELDLDCDQNNDLETGWARVRALGASPGFGDAALLGAISAGPGKNVINGGHLLWESVDRHPLDVEAEFLKIQFN